MLFLADKELVDFTQTLARLKNILPKSISKSFSYTIYQTCTHKGLQLFLLLSNQSLNCITEMYSFIRKLSCPNTETQLASCMLSKPAYTTQTVITKGNAKQYPDCWLQPVFNSYDRSLVKWSSQPTDSLGIVLSSHTSFICLQGTVSWLTEERPLSALAIIHSLHNGCRRSRGNGHTQRLQNGFKILYIIQAS